MSKVVVKDWVKRRINRVPLPSLWYYARYGIRRFLSQLNQPEIKFIIFGQGRTGSTLLVDLLNSHPDVTCEGEILAQKVFSPHAYLTCRSALNGKTRVYGFKVKVYHLTHFQKIKHAAQFMESLHDQGWKIIYLKRENLLEHAVSNMRVQQTESYHQRLGEQIKTVGKIHVDYAQLLTRMQKRERYQKEEQAMLERVPHLTVVYETDLRTQVSQKKTAEKLFQFLGIDNHTVQTELVRINRGHLSDMVANLSEIRDKLKMTRFEKFVG